MLTDELDAVQSINVEVCHMVASVLNFVIVSSHCCLLVYLYEVMPVLAILSHVSSRIFYQCPKYLRDIAQQSGASCR